MLGEQRRVVDGRHDEAVTKPLGVLERQPCAIAGNGVRFGCEPTLPEVERRAGGDAPLHRVHHPGAGAAPPHARVLEERDVAARRARLVGVEEVVDGRIVLVDRLLHHPEPEDTRVEVDVPRSIARDARDVMEAVERQPPEPNRTGLS